MTETHPVHRRLIRCPECGMWNGIINRRDLTGDRHLPNQDQFEMVLCLCDGPLCSRCGENRIWRPISNYYDEANDRIWHVLVATLGK